MKRSRTLAPFLAAGLTAAVLPWSTATAAPVAAKEVDFGFSAESRSAPVQVEIYEPVIPLPATPQAEVNLGYTEVLAQSGSGQGRASYLWPGDPVGEGAKTVIENIGLPKEIADPLAAQGYPIQVNSNHPAGPKSEADEPFPGTVMRTSASEGKVTAATGFSSDCDVSGDGGTGGGDGGDGGDSPLPDLPGVPTGQLGGLLGGGAKSSQEGEGSAMLSDFGAAITGQESQGAGSGAAAEEEQTPCPIPADLKALVDVGGGASYTETVVDENAVTSTSRAVVGDVALVGGLVRISGISTKAVTSSDGTKEKAGGAARYGSLFIGPAEFALGPDGVEGGGQKQEIPGLPDEPKAALKQLGITITTAKPRYSTKDMTATALVDGLIVEFDMGVLSPALRQIPVGDIIGPIPFPEEFGPIKSAIGALNQLSSRIVLHLGKSTSETQRAPELDLPTTEPPSNNTTGDGEGGGDTSGGGTGAGTSTGGTAGTAGTPGTPGTPGTEGTPTGGDAGASDGALADGELAAGLPPLNSIPGALLIGGIALATVAGSYLRRLGAAALGGGAACSHGLDSGLPDLRRA